MKHIHLFAPLHNAVNYSVDMGLMTVKKMPQVLIFRRDGAAIRALFRPEDFAFDTSVPLQRTIGMSSINSIVDRGKITFRTGRDINEIGHAQLQIR